MVYQQLSENFQVMANSDTLILFFKFFCNDQFQKLFQGLVFAHISTVIVGQLQTYFMILKVAKLFQ